ncbi:hypothetical protein NPIL_116741 [Nephila pilipes]|uniref:Uncharacterized protein n=1 Tax=Nephila pilipes TaxID=299642 RepID=A0A8X6MI83_NEPPI|nr:hypothetical protein NPIL_116741 [Nephila pilipes]
MDIKNAIITIENYGVEFIRELLVDAMEIRKEKGNSERKRKHYIYRQFESQRICLLMERIQYESGTNSSTEFEEEKRIKEGRKRKMPKKKARDWRLKSSTVLK